MRSGVYPNCSTLALAIKVTEKTIQRDLQFMRKQCGLPLEYDRVRHGHFYTRPTSEFPLMELSRADVLALFLARKALVPMQGTKLAQSLTQSLERIASLCADTIAFQWQDLDAFFAIDSRGVVEADAALFGDLIEAVQERREVRFQYHKLTASEESTRRAQPLLLRQMDGGWYVLAWDVDRQEIRNFALQRIRGLMVLLQTFERRAESEIQEHLSGSFGVWSYVGDGSEPTLIRIRFIGYAARIVAERQWHATQEVLRLENEVGGSPKVELRLKLRGLEEVARWVLSWGEHAEVLEPLVLREKVAGEARRMVENYAVLGAGQGC